MPASSRLRTAVGVVVAAALSVATVIALPPATAAAVPSAAVTQPPDQDPFYQPPAGYESTAPGTVLRSRPMDIASFATIPIKVKGWQLLYRTTDSLGKPTATVTTVLLPWDAKPDAKRPLVSYQIAEDSVTTECAPSYQLAKGGGSDNIVSQAELILIAAAVRKGWAVSVPDYEGPNSAYTAGRMAGQGVLDGVRAAERFDTLGLDGANTPVGFWGYSGGALASGWAAELQHGYAPELNVKGVAEGGLPTQLTPTLDAVNKGPLAVVAITGIAGLSKQYPEFADYLNANMTDEGKQALKTAQSACLSGNATNFLFKDMYSYFKNKDPLNQRVPQKVLADNMMGVDTVPKMPMFVYHSVNDEVVPHGPTDAYVQRQCGRGAQITYHRDILSEHIALAITGAADALNYLSDRFDAKQAPAGCSTSTVVSSLATPKAFATFGDVLLKSLLALLGQPQKPTDFR